jgi:hypothetical protein
MPHDTAPTALFLLMNLKNQFAEIKSARRKPAMR